MTKGQVKSLIGLLAAYAAMFFTGYQVGNIMTVKKAKNEIDEVKSYFKNSEDFWSGQVKEYEIKTRMAKTAEKEKYYSEILYDRMQQMHEASVKRETCDQLKNRIETFC